MSKVLALGPGPFHVSRRLRRGPWRMARKLPHVELSCAGRLERRICEREVSVHLRSSRHSLRISLFDHLLNRSTGPESDWEIQIGPQLRRFQRRISNGPRSRNGS